MSILLSTMLASTLSISEPKTINPEEHRVSSPLSTAISTTFKYANNTLVDKANPALKEVMKPSSFAMYLEKYKEDDNKATYSVDNLYEMIAAVDSIYEELPTHVEITSKYLKADELKSLYNQAESLKIADLTPVFSGLANYSINKDKLNLPKSKKAITLTDKANPQYNAKTIKNAFDAYVKDLAAALKGQTEKETVQNVYDYMFNNFSYNASGVSYMRVGNIANGELACNGFSYLADALFEEVGIESYIRSGFSHFWNVLTLESGEMTFDVTSDIVLNEYKATLGTSTKEHIDKVSSIGFYSAQFTNGLYHEVESNNMFK